MNRSTAQLRRFMLILVLLLAPALRVSAEVDAWQRMDEDQGWISLHTKAQPSISPVGVSTVQAHALVTADFDSDGVLDLVSGISIDGVGQLRLQAGNPDQLYPNTLEAQQRRSAGSGDAVAFSGVQLSISLSQRPELLAAGDFDADGKPDLVAAERGRFELWWLRGDGHGGFSEPQALSLNGSVRALVAGEINRADGLTDLVLALDGPLGDQIAVFEHPDGALRGSPELWPAEQAVNALVLTRLDDDDFIDLLVGGESWLWLLPGRDRMLSTDSLGRLRASPGAPLRVAVDQPVSALASGDFLSDDRHRSDLAVSSADGTLHVFRGEQLLSTLQGDGKRLADAPSSLLRPAPGSAAGTLGVTRSSAIPIDNLLWMDPSGALEIWVADTLGQSAQAFAGRFQSNGAAAVAAFAIHLDPDALSDLVVLDASGEVSVLVSAAGCTFTINDARMLPDPNLPDGNCDVDLVAPDMQCTLPAALANANRFADADYLCFSIGNGPVTIAKDILLQAIFPLTIDGTTQPGYVGIPIVEIKDVSTPGNAGFTFFGGNSVITGLVRNVGGFSLQGQSNYVVTGNFLGLEQGGLSAPPVSYGLGVAIAQRSTIGGNHVAARNVISGYATGKGIAFGSGTPGGTQIVGNYIGTDRNGQNAVPNEVGIDMLANNVAPLVVVGGGQFGAGNLISGNLRQGITVGSNGIVIQGNRIGTDVSGNLGLGNGEAGIEVGGIPNNITIGGSGATSGNLIAANGVSASGNRPGILYFADGFGTLIQGNTIGAGSSGAPLGNGLGGIQASGIYTIGGSSGAAGNTIVHNIGDGVFMGGGSGSVDRLLIGNRIGDYFGQDAPNTLAAVRVGATNSRVGGTDLSSANYLFHTTNPGVAIAGATQVAVLGNHFRDDHSIAGLAIDLANDGVTPNDPGDADSGANNLLNFPLLSPAPGGVDFTFDGPAGTQTFRLELYSVAGCDPSGHGEGRDLITSIEVLSNASGDISGVFPGVPSAFQVSATATRFVNGIPAETSEFSPCSQLQANSVVNTIGDGADNNPGDGLCNTGAVVLRNGIPEAECSLRAAIMDANAHAGTDAVSFDVIGAGLSEPLITPNSALPLISETILIDGRTQPGAGRIGISGALLGVAANALAANGARVIARGLHLQRFGGAALRLNGGSLHTLCDNLIGHDSGAAAGEANGMGIELINANDVQVCDSTISGNTGHGVLVNGGSRLQLTGNFIGTDVRSGATVGNGGSGLRLQAAADAVIGNNVFARNAIGVEIVAGSGHLLAANHIGIDRQRNVLLGQLGDGVRLDQSSDNSLLSNVIVRSGAVGVHLLGIAARDNVLRGNRIGIDEADQPGLGNGSHGVFIEGGADNLIEADPNEPCVIASNGRLGAADGVRIVGLTATGNAVLNCQIGVASDGSSARGNSRHGVALIDAGPNQIGGDRDSQGNQIGANGGNGVLIQGPAGATAGSGQAIAGNLIGVDSGAGLPLPNQGDGVRVEGSAFNLIGGAVSIRGNLISANLGSGVTLLQSFSNQVHLNLIGLDLFSFPLGNGMDGVAIIDGSGNVIGSQATPNLIGFNLLDGIRVAENTGSSRSNALRGNLLAENGRLAINLDGGSQDSFGVTSNDLDDSDLGPNALQNYPESTSVRQIGAFTEVRTRLVGTPGQRFELDYYAVENCDPSGFGEAEEHLDISGVVVPAGGVATPFAVLASNAQAITMIATDELGNSSELSACGIPLIPPQQVLINEVDAQAAPDAVFIELHSTGIFPLNGLALVLFDGSDDASYAAFDLDGLFLGADGHFLIGPAALPGVDLVIADGLLLAQNAAVALYLADAIDFPNDTPVTTAGLKDALVYGAPPADSGLLILLEEGQPQRDEAEGGSAALDSLQRCPNDAGDARFSDAYATAIPTPGAANGCVVCQLSPFSASDQGEISHSVVASVRQNRTAALPGVAVTFQIPVGPNMGGSVVVNTDAQGLARFDYDTTGDGGTDQIRANGTTQGQRFACTASKDWGQDDLIFANGFEGL